MVKTWDLSEDQSSNLFRSFLTDSDTPHDSICTHNTRMHIKDINEAISAWGQSQGHINEAEAVIFGFEAEASCDEAEAKFEATPKI